MRKYMTALLFVAVSAGLTVAGSAAAAPSAEQQEIIKKKKRVEALKAAARAEEAELARANARMKARAAAEARRDAATKAKLSAAKAQAARAQAARAQAAKIESAKAKLAAVRARKKSDAMLAERAQARNASRRQCGTFFKCMFSDSRRRPRSTQVAALSGGGISNRSMRQVVDWDETRYSPGSLIVRTPERALYYVMPGGEAIRYSVGVGKEGFQWSGNGRISAKQEWPTWRPPATMIEREAAKGHILPEVMEGGPGNPLGARALYIGGTLFRVHGTNNEASIGGAVSSGCIRMMNADVIDLYGRVKLGAKIYVYQ